MYDRIGRRAGPSTRRSLPVTTKISWSLVADNGGSESANNATKSVSATVANRGTFLSEANLSTSGQQITTSRRSRRNVLWHLVLPNMHYVPQSCHARHLVQQCRSSRPASQGQIACSVVCSHGLQMTRPFRTAARVTALQASAGICLWRQIRAYSRSKIRVHRTSQH